MSARNILILLAVLLVLGGVYLAVNWPEPGESPQPKVYVWDVEMGEITRIEISLPRQELSQTFIKIAEGDWRFDDPPQYSPINPNRWGAGPPLLVSGPVAYRVIRENATAEQLDEYGLAQPSMQIAITIANGDTIETDIGDKTPDSENCYVRAPGTSMVALVDSTWYDVLSGLVTNPPYASAGE